MYQDLIKVDLQTRKIMFIQEFLRLQNEEIITGLETMLKKKKFELFGNKPEPMKLSQFNNEINQALYDSENNRVTKAADLKNKIQEWA